MAIRWTTAMLDLPSDVLDETLGFWLRVTGTSLSPWRGLSDEFATLVAPDGDDFLRVQRFDDGPRVHLDLHVGDDEELRAELVRALALGAAIEHDPGTHVVLSSPGGYVFCLVTDQGHARRPAAVPAPDVGPAAESDEPVTALVDQLCLDVPAAGFAQEAAFWSELTRWPAHTGSREEFVVLDRPDGIPLRLMLQRLGATDPRREVSAHLDLATTNRPAVERAHVAAGARVLAHGPRWTTLADPSGHPYCLTDRDPTTGRLPTAAP
ncbi:VOC family protein [Cellulomonas persica]|uniref:Glyoxalase-like domain-containing protein n=1 Tax=Cellulomonas persica TaxID=76861 RepID=A0A510USQ7_9CELL|nr:VOC family protein [Cellulomonas persica]GEK17619.1 hypothetical protein CPE01_13520 [Cellulomonas persica]